MTTKQSMMTNLRSLQLAMLSLGCAALVFTSGCDEEEGNDDGAGATDSSDPTGDSADPTGDSADPTSDSGGECDPMGEDPCPEYTECAQNMCDAEYKECLGAGYMDGNFAGGTCEEFMNCSAACACDDTACQQGCSEMHFAGDCQTCMGMTIGTCALANCMDLLCQG